MKKNKNKKKKFGECNSLVVRPRMSPEVAHFLFHNRNSAEINALSHYITNRFEDALSNTNACIALECKLEDVINEPETMDLLRQYGE